MRSTINPFVAVGITIGLLAGLWTWMSASLGLTTWAAFVSWALFFAAGGKARSVLTILPPMLTGVAYGTFVLLTVVAVGGDHTLPLGVAVIAFVMCVQASWQPLAFIPAAFAGCAALFGAAGDWLQVGIALILGALLGWASEALAGVLTRPRRAPAPAPAG